MSSVQKQVRFPKELAEWIEERATENGLNFSEMIRMMLTRQMHTMQERDRIWEELQRRGKSPDGIVIADPSREEQRENGL